MPVPVSRVLLRCCPRVVNWVVSWAQAASRLPAAAQPFLVGEMFSASMLDVCQCLSCQAPRALQLVVSPCEEPVSFVHRNLVVAEAPLPHEHSTIPAGKSSAFTVLFYPLSAREHQRDSHKMLLILARNAVAGPASATHPCI